MSRSEWVAGKLIIIPITGTHLYNKGKHETHVLLKDTNVVFFNYEVSSLKSKHSIHYPLNTALENPDGLDDLSKEELVDKVRDLQSKIDRRDEATQKAVKTGGKGMLWFFAGPRLYSATNKAWDSWIKWLEEGRQKDEKWPEEETGKLVSSFVARFYRIGFISLLIAMLPILVLAFQSLIMWQQSKSLYTQNQLFENQSYLAANTQISQLKPKILAEFQFDPSKYDLKKKIDGSALRTEVNGLVRSYRSLALNHLTLLNNDPNDLVRVVSAHLGTGLIRDIDLSNSINTYIQTRSTVVNLSDTKILELEIMSDPFSKRSNRIPSMKGALVGYIFMYIPPMESIEVLSDGDSYSYAIDFSYNPAYEEMSGHKLLSVFSNAICEMRGVGFIGTSEGSIFSTSELQEVISKKCPGIIRNHLKDSLRAVIKLAP